MTYWQVGEFFFDADTHRLSGNGAGASLEPKVSALLAYFCRHPGRNIDRTELIDAVWHGQIVTDNSISRAVALLRKALRDDGETRRYITTVPKLGYRLIADVRIAEKASAAAVRPPNARASIWLVVATAGLAGALAVYSLTRPDAVGDRPAAADIVPLSRLAVTQSNADLARDGRGLVYTASDRSGSVVFFAAGPDAEPQAISAPNGEANFASWSHDDAFVVYQFTAGERCEFHRIERDQFAARTADVIYECLPGSYSELSLSPDSKTLYFLERVTPFAPYAVHALDMERGVKRRLSQPVATGYGNHFVDVHPATGELLLLSDHEPGKTSVYGLDAASDSYALLRSFDYGLDSAIWSQRDGYMVHPSRHPSYQLLESPLDGGDSRVLVSDSRRISGPRRIDGPAATPVDYLFTSYLYNRDIDVVDVDTDPLNSAVMDYLPALSRSGDRLAFISKRSGDSQIWIKDFQDGGLTTVKPPEPGRRFHELAWSPNGDLLLASTSTGVLVLSVAEQAYSHNIALELPAYGTSWFDDETLAFSHYEGGRWRAYHVRLASGEVVALDERWAFSVGNTEQQVFLDQELLPFRDGVQLGSLSACANPLWRYQLRYRLDGRDLYCHALDAPDDLLRFDAAMQATRLPNAVPRFEFFSVSGGRVASSRVASAHSDIMRIRSRN